MNEVVPAQAEVDALNAEYEAYIQKLRTAWLNEHRVRSKNVIEVMDPDERAEVHQRIAQWGTYITPFAEAWWKERGYDVIWPPDASEPMKVFKLKAA